MTITQNNYPQFRDYLSKLMSLSGTDGLPKITQKQIADKLRVGFSGVSSFLSKETKQPKKMLGNFIVTYPSEFQKWPEGKKTIKRTLLKVDALYFLGLPLQIAPPLNLPPLALVTAAPIRRADKFVPEAMMRAPIAISYRGHESDKDGKGMLFDHMRIQIITDFSTSTLGPESKEITDAAKKRFNDELRNHPAKLPFGDQNQDLITVPPYVETCSELGLLIIPGRMRDNENEPIRLAHEYQVLRNAFNRGQPIMGICAGSWRVWEQLFIWTKFPNRLSEDPIQLSNWQEKDGSLVEVTDHTYSRMLGLSTTGTDATYNVQIHKVVISKKSLLKRMLGKTTLGESVEPMTVNSVHSKAVNPGRPPANVLISAKAIKHSKIFLNNRSGKLMDPEENTVEAFETRFGAPIIGLQWHPEGYGKNTAHSNLIKYMALAGSAYAAKRKMLSQIIKPN